MTEKFPETEGGLQQEMMTAMDKDIAFITGEGVGEPLGVSPDMWQAEMKDTIIRTRCMLPPHRNIRREFDEMAASLEERLREKVPLLDVHVARYGQSCIDGMPPRVLLIRGKVTINEGLFSVTIPVGVKMWQAWKAQPEHPLEVLVHRMTTMIAEAIVEWWPKEAP